MRVEKSKFRSFGLYTRTFSLDLQTKKSKLRNRNEELEIQLEFKNVEDNAIRQEVDWKTDRAKVN